MDEVEIEQARNDWARHPDNLQFEGDAVDWWDMGAAQWRPTVIKEILLEPRFPRKRAVIYLPGEGVEMVERVVPFRLLKPAERVGSAASAWFAFLPQVEAAAQVAEELAKRKGAGELGAREEEGVEISRPMVGPDGEELTEEKLYQWITDTQADAWALWADWKAVFEGGEEIDAMATEFDPGMFANEGKEI